MYELWWLKEDLMFAHPFLPTSKFLLPFSSAILKAEWLCLSRVSGNFTRDSDAVPRVSILWFAARTMYCTLLALLVRPSVLVPRGSRC